MAGADGTSVADPPVDSAVLHLHPLLAVVGEPPELIHLEDGWRDPLPSAELAAALRVLTEPSSIDHAVQRIGVEEPAAEHVRAELRSLHDQRVLLAGVPAHGPGLFSCTTATLGAALAGPVADAVVVGMPYDVGTTVRPGAREAPRALRELGGAALTLGPEGVWDPRLRRQVLAGRRIVDVGDIEAPVHTRNGPTFDRLRRTVHRSVEAGALGMVLGGDHSIALAVSHGVGDALGEHVVVQFDAHADRGGAPDADWRRHLHHGNVGDHLLASTSVERLVQVGVRQRTPTPMPDHERVVVLPPAESSPGAVLDAIPAGLPVHLSIDVDVLDPAVVTGTGTPVPGGLDLPTLVALVQAVSAEHEVVAIDCCELIPDGDVAGAVAVAEVLASALISVSESTRA